MRTLSDRIIITEKTIRQNDYLVCAKYDEKRMTEIHLQKKQDREILGSIRIGRIETISENLQGAFVEIEKGLSCFCPFKELKTPVFTKKQGKKPLCVGDELLVEVTRENVKTKPPMVSGNLNLNGRYLILTTGDCTLGISKKLDSKERERLRDVLEPRRGKDYGLIVRTCAKDVKTEQILEDLASLEEEYRRLLEYAGHRTLYSVIREAVPSYLKFLNGQNLLEAAKITTDLPDIYQILCEHFREEPVIAEKLCLYQDDLVSLSALYSLEHELERTLGKRVWLPSGGYLVIEPTEALTVIDVNSGKNTKNSSKDDMVFAVNREAAIETARQLILRNISGICIVDFIDMKKEQQKELVKILRKELKKDKIPATLVDITSLGLVELTRKKVQKSLKEQLQGAELYEK